MTVPKPPVWVDNNILVNIDKGNIAFENEILKLHKDGHEVLIPKSVEREFLHGQGFRTADTLRRQGILKRLPVKVDTMAGQGVSMQQLRAWRDQAIRNGLSIPDADVIVQVRASAQARGIRNPLFLTRDTKKGGGAIRAMRRNNVLAVEFKAQAVEPHVHVSTPKIPEPPRPGFFRARINSAKIGLTEGIKGAFSPANLASMIPELVLAIADQVAAREAAKNIQIKFLKEGFAKGFAAGVMGWTDAEVQSNLKNRITPFRVQGLEDPAGFLKRAYILQLAEASENYGVDVGFYYSSSKGLGWKEQMLKKGFHILKKYRYDFPNDPAILFEYEFIDKFAFALRYTTNAIVEPAIRFSQNESKPGGRK